MHSHLLPNVDDGSKSVEDSHHLIDELNELGFSHVITTPHIYQAFYPNSRESLEEARQKVERPIAFAAEYFVDENFEKLMTAKNLLTFGQNHVLIETSFAGIPLNLDSIIFELIAMGYKPILAHPERYNYAGNPLTYLDKLVDMGCQLQLNINSVGGYYGKSCQELANKILKENKAAFLGTDLHNSKHLAYLKKIAGSRKIMRLLEKYPWKNPSLIP